MYKVENCSERYYIYDLEREKYLRVNIDKVELIDYIAHHQTFGGGYLLMDYSEKYSNDILDNLNMTGKDTEVYYDYYNTRVESLRKYLVLDGEYRYVDVRDLYYEISLKAQEISFSTHKRYRKKSYIGVEFRKDPVPKTGKNVKYNRYTSVKTTDEKRQNSGKDITEYIRPSRRPKNLPSIYDHKLRNIGKSWKNNKKKSQWVRGDIQG